METYVEWRAENPDRKFVWKDIKIKPIEDEHAFQKGVDYFVEILIFYGLLGVLSVYELRKQIISSREQKHRLDNIESTGNDALKEARELK